MKLSDLSIRRPVLASMLSLALVLFGVIGYLQLSVREYPDVDPPIVSVTTVLPGANPQVVESAVTDILEEELSTVQGLRTLTSSSGEEQSATSPWSSPSTATSRTPPRTSATRSPACADACPRTSRSRSSPSRTPTPSRSSGWRSAARTTTCSGCPTSPTGS